MSEALSLGAEYVWHEPDHLHPSNGAITKAWSYAPQLLCYALFPTVSVYELNNKYFPN
jgi:hypothetical protein